MFHLFFFFLFKSHILKQHKYESSFSRLLNDNLDDNFFNHNISMIPIEFNDDTINEFLELNSLNIKLNENDIIDDSFEGYLRSHFIKLDKINEKYIDFDTFYNWRKHTIGSVLNKYELYDIFYNFITNGGCDCDGESCCDLECDCNNNLCDLIQFIAINKIIDEQDGAMF